MKSQYNKTLTILQINIIFFTQIYAFCEIHPVKFQIFYSNGFGYIDGGVLLTYREEKIHTALNSP